jgi:hypothetical protein
VNESSARYLAYGSNLAPARLRAYIDGADAGSVYGHHEPCEDTSDTPALRAHWIRGRLVFGGRSVRWGGGTATVDLLATSEWFFAVEYELTRVQFAHLVRQESPTNTAEVDWPALLDSGRCSVGEGGHGVVARPAGHHGLLVTTPRPPVPTSPPTAYVATMRAGLLNWMRDLEADDYLRRLVAGSEREPGAS